MPALIAQSQPAPVAFLSPLLSAGPNANACQVSGATVGPFIFPVPNTVITPGATSRPAVSLFAPGSDRLEGIPFLVKAGGIAYAAAGATLQVGLYYVANLTYNSAAFQRAQTTPASWTLAQQSAALTITVATITNWALTATLQGSSQSGTLVGSASYTVANLAPTAGAPVTNPLTLAPGIAGGMHIEPPVVFAVGITFGAANALNLAQMNYFYMEA